MTLLLNDNIDGLRKNMLQSLLTYVKTHNKELLGGLKGLGPMMGKGFYKMIKWELRTIEKKVIR